MIEHMYRIFKERQMRKAMSDLITTEAAAGAHKEGGGGGGGLSHESCLSTEPKLC